MEKRNSNGNKRKQGMSAVLAMHAKQIRELRERCDGYEELVRILSAYLTVLADRRADGACEILLDPQEITEASRGLHVEAKRHNGKYLLTLIRDEEPEEQEPPVGEAAIEREPIQDGEAVEQEPPVEEEKTEEIAKPSETSYAEE